MMAATSSASGIAAISPATRRAASANRTSFTERVERGADRLRSRVLRVDLDRGARAVAGDRVAELVGRLWEADLRAVRDSRSPGTSRDPRGR